MSFSCQEKNSLSCHLFRGRYVRKDHNSSLITLNLHNNIEDHTTINSQLDKNSKQEVLTAPACIYDFYTSSLFRQAKL